MDYELRAFICEGCGETLEVKDISIVGPGMLTWCESCQDKADEKSVEFNCKLKKGELTIKEILERSKGARAYQS